MNFLRALFVLSLLAFSIHAQNYTVEFERVIEGAENFGTIEPVVELTGEISWMIVIDNSIKRFVAHDLMEDTSFIFPITGIPLAVESFPIVTSGLSSVYVAYHQGSNLTVGNFAEVLGVPTYLSLTVDYLNPPDWPTMTFDHKAHLEPVLVDGSLSQIMVGASYLWGGMWVPGDVTEFRRNWSTLVAPDLSGTSGQLPYFHLATGILMSDNVPETCGYTDNYSLISHYDMEWGWYSVTSASSTMNVLDEFGHTIHTITSNQGKYYSLFVNNFNKTDLYDEIIYEANSIPLNQTTGSIRHTGCFSMSSGEPERLWLRTDIIELQYYYDTENLLVFLSDEGRMTLVNAATGETTQNINLDRSITTVEFFTNQATNTLGLVGRVHDTIFVYNFGSPTPVEEPVNTLPTSFTLAQNYPNPFNPSTTISFFLKQPGQVELSIYNITGQKVTTLENNLVSAGEHRIEWHGMNNDGQPVASGVYLYRLKTDNNSQTRKMLLIK